MFQQAILMLHTMKWKIINVILQIFIFDADARGKFGVVGVTLGLREKNTRKCKRLLRKAGWWNKVWNMYSDDRFQKCFRVTKGTFQYI